MNRKVQQGQATYRRLLKIARQAIEQHGYAATTTQQIITKAGLTKGAFYHHFASKADLFEAVYRQAELAMGEQIKLASTANDKPFDQLVAGCFAYLDCCCQGALHRILRVEGPAALGHARWQAIDREFGVERLLPFINQLTQAGVINPPSPEAFAFQITGAMNEATFWVSQHPEPTNALADSKRMLQHFLDSVRC